jgi:hypothetical protein
VIEVVQDRAAQRCLDAVIFVERAGGQVEKGRLIMFQMETG